jgi:cytochrome c oxidase subunit 2
VDQNYIRESILDPQKHIVKGFEGIMPTFQGLLREREILGVIEYIKSLK